jgi:hypothetical protein
VYPVRKPSTEDSAKGTSKPGWSKRKQRKNNKYAPIKKIKVKSSGNCSPCATKRKPAAGKVLECQSRVVQLRQNTNADRAKTKRRW